MCFGILDFQKKLRDSVVSDGITFSTGIMPKGTNQVGFSTASLPSGDNVQGLFDKTAACKLEDGLLIYSSVR